MIAMENVPVALKGGSPLSVTRRVMKLVDGMGASDIFQVNNPVVGSMAAPAGAPGSRLKVNVWTALSESVAVAVNETVSPIWTNLLVVGPRTGAVLGITLLVLGVGNGMKKRLTAPSG